MAIATAYYTYDPDQSNIRFADDNHVMVVVRLPIDGTPARIDLLILNETRTALDVVSFAQEDAVAVHNAIDTAFAQIARLDAGKEAAERAIRAAKKAGRLH